MSEAPWFSNYEDGVPRSLSYPEVPLTRFLDDSAEHCPGAAAVIFEGRRLSYRELRALVDSFAAALTWLGAGKGDRIALLLPNCPPYVIGYYAVLKIGALAVNLNPLSVERELLNLLNHAEAKAVLVAEPLFPRIAGIAEGSPLKSAIVACLKEWTADKPAGRKRPLSPAAGGKAVFSFETLLRKFRGKKPPGVSVKPDDEAVLQYTGAITDGIKGVVLTHRNLVANTLQIGSWVVRARRGKEVFLSVLPFFHVYGMAVAMNVPILFSAAMLILPRFEVFSTLKAVKRYRPTFFPGVPTMFIALAQEKDAEKYDLACLRVCYSGGAPLSLETLDEFEKLTGARVTEGYGLAEASPATHCNPIFGKRKRGSVGLPYPDTLARIADLEDPDKILGPGEVGELCIKGPQVMKGYWKMPEETARTVRDGWLFTGDIARMDEEGYFYILDVKKDMIIAGGFNIYPKDIDQILAEHPKVAEAVAVGVPDRYRGETVKAFVVLKPGEKAGEEEILNFCRQNLAKYKVPARVEFRASLPKTSSGKILRRLLRRLESEKTGAPPEPEISLPDRKKED